MSECWAASLGDCAGKISREHIISKGIFLEDQIRVNGFDWCPEEPVTIGLASLTKKILCQKHNSDLSTADNAGIKTVEQFREFFRLGDVRGQARSRRWRVVRLRTDGFELERWFLKTLVNVAVGRPYPLFKTVQSPKWQPPPHLVEIAFGLKRFQPSAGLYLANESGQRIDPNAKLQIMTFIDAAERLVGARFIMFGFAFFLYLETEGLGREKPAFFIDRSGRADKIPKALYRPRLIRYTLNNKYLSHSLEIDWASFSDNLSANTESAQSRRRSPSS
jgi:hypothetical protein